MHDVNDLSVHLDVTDIQYAWNDVIKTSQSSCLPDAIRDAIRTHYRDRAVDRCRTFSLGTLRIFHARGTAVTYVVDNGH